MFSHSSNYYGDSIFTGTLATPDTLLGANLQNIWQIPSPVHGSLCTDTKEDKIRLLKVTKLLTVQYL